MKHVYIHGLGQMPDSWKNVILQTEDAEHSICPDLAQLLGDREATYQNLYEAFSAFCNEIEGQIILCGLSLGSILALHYAIDNPEKVERLILLAPQYKMPKKLLKFQNLVFRLMPQSCFAQMGFEKRDFLKLCSSMMDLDFSREVAKISCPSLIVYGEKDKANQAAAIELAALMQCAALNELRGAGHEINAEAPDRLAAVIREFLHT